MWIVHLALRRPYTFIVLAVLIVLFGVSTILRMPADMFPQIDIPVVAAIWQYPGLPPSEMEGRITSQFERALTTTVSGIEHIESQSLAGDLVAVTPGPDNGNTVDVVAGLSGGEQVIATPPSGVADGMQVQGVSAS